MIDTQQQQPASLPEWEVWLSDSMAFFAQFPPAVDRERAREVAWWCLMLPDKNVKVDA